MKKWGKVLFWTGLAALLLANSGARRLLRSALELRRADGRLADLKKEESALRQELNALKTDDGHLEAVARRELGMLKPGEVEYRFKTGEGGEGSGESRPAK